MVSEQKWNNLRLKMEKLGLQEDRLEEKFIRSSGKGGQNVNKVSSCVFLRDKKTGLEVKCQRTRSQSDNRYFARRILCEKLESQILGKKSAEKKKIEKIKRQKRKRSKRAKEKMLQEKKKQSAKKDLRKKPRSWD